MQPERLSFQLKQRRLAALAWGPADAPIIIALHGWLDNAESFYLLAPQLSEFRVIALDLAGHGESDWLDGTLGYPVTQYVADLRELIELLAVDRVRLLGHSLGAGVVSLFAGIWPERVERLGLIENLGSAPDAGQNFAQALKETIERNLQAGVKVQPRSLEVWVRSRMNSQFAVPREAAERLMQRALRPDGEDGLVLRTDPRLRHRTVRLTEEQVQSALGAIEAPVCLVLGKQGLTSTLTQSRLRCVQNLQLNEVEGGHHLHMEADSALQIAELLRPFYH